MNLKKYISTTEAAETAYRSTITLEQLNKEFTFNHFREMATQTREQIKADKAQLAEDIKNVRDIYNQSMALKKIEELRSAQADSVQVAKDALSRELKNIIDVKTAELQRNVTATPKPELLSMLQALTMRTGRISEAEFDMLIPVCAGNYMAMSVLHDLAEKADYSFRMPFTPEGYITDIKDVTGIITDAINELDADDLTYNSTEFYNFNADTHPNGRLTTKFSDLDSAPALNVVLPAQTLKEKLESFIDAKLNAAADKAVNGEDNNAEYKDALKAKQFLKENKDIATEEDAAHAAQARRTELEAEAVEIMSSANE